MSFRLPKNECETHSNKRKFGLCDDPAPKNNPAYIDEDNGENWIATIINHPLHNITFTAIDHCIEIKRADDRMAKRCDGVLTYNSTIAFVELKERGTLGSAWVKEAEEQLRVTIENFESKNQAQYLHKRAYIANRRHPTFKESQIKRMEKFTKDTGYVLRIENRIITD